MEAWTDMFGGWQHEFTAKFEAGLSNLASEALEGAALVEAAAGRAVDADDATRLLQISENIRTADNAEINEIVHSGELEVLMLPMPDRPGELAMIMKRLAEAEINVKFLYLGTDTRVVIGVDDITQARAVLSQRRTS